MMETGRIKWHKDYRGRERAFIRDVLGNRPRRQTDSDHGSTLWQFPRDMIDALFKHKRVAITSSRGTAKTYTLGQIVPAFMFTEPSRCIVVTPTLRQGQKGVMGEARAAMARSTRVLATESLNASEIRIDERHWALCLPARDPDAMRGFHASPDIPADPDDDVMSDDDAEWLQAEGEDTSTRMLIIVDEAPGVSAEAFRVLRGMLTKPNVYMILTGNPTLGADEDHDYVRAFHEGSPFYRMRVSSVPVAAFPSPQGIEYDKTYQHVPEYLVSAKEIANAQREYEPSDPILIADWAGTFPSGSTEFNVVPRSALEAALGTNEANLRPLGPRIGVDIGTGSPDMSAACLYVDGVKRTEYVWAPDADDREGQVSTASMIQALAAKWGDEVKGVGPGGSEWGGEPIPGDRISIDDSGLVGVCDILSSRGLYVDRVNFAKGPAGQWRDIVGGQRFLNQRTEMHWVARRGLQEGIFVIPREFRRSWNEATWTHFLRAFDSKGPIVKLEPKEKVKKRNGGRSPDVFDADILAMRETSDGNAFGQSGPMILTQSKSGQPIRAGRLRPTRLKGGRKIG